MKKYLYACVAMLAMACSRGDLQTPEENGENPGEPKMYTVSLALEGKNVEIDQEPLSRAGEGTNDLYWIQIVQTPLAGGSSSHYAYGVFSKKENMTVKLAEGNTYSVAASLIKDGRDKIWMDLDSMYRYPVTDWGRRLKITNGFVVTPNENVTPYMTDVYISKGTDYCEVDFPEINRFYGKVIGYVPVENGKIAINMYRMLFGYRVEMNPFEEGLAIVNFLDYTDTIHSGTTVTKRERENQWGYNWSTIDNYGQDDSAEAQEQINNMTGSPYLNVRWVSPQGDEIVVYNKEVTVQRLKRSIFKITLKKGVAQNGSVEMSLENVEITDGEITDIEGNIGDGTDTDIDTGITKPAWWDANVESSLLGKYSAKKYETLILETGVSDWTGVDAATRKTYALQLKAYVQFHDIKEIDGSSMIIPVVE